MNSPKTRGSFDTGVHMAREEQCSVVLNEEGQYSIWPVGRHVPAGWHEVGKTGGLDECLSYIDEVWIDMRPRSLRESLAQSAKDS